MCSMLESHDDSAQIREPRAWGRNKVHSSQIEEEEEIANRQGLL
jgi:hypothetical protein